MAEEGQVMSCHHVDAWKQHLQSAIESNKLVVVDFMASWCRPCCTISPILVEIAKKMLDVIFLKVDVDELMVIAEEYQVEVMLTFVILKDGKVVDTVMGAKKEELQLTIAKHATTTVAT